jgi:hypothetical protein
VLFSPQPRPPGGIDRPKNGETGVILFLPPRVAGNLKGVVCVPHAGEAPARRPEARRHGEERDRLCSLHDGQPSVEPLLQRLRVAAGFDRTLLKLNARAVAGHFAIKVLRGEEYFVVIHNVAAEAVAYLDLAGQVRRIAQSADGLEDRLSRGRDLY